MWQYRLYIVLTRWIFAHIKIILLGLAVILFVIFNNSFASIYANIVFNQKIYAHPSIKDIKNWYVYRNDALGFSLRLPPDYVVDQTDNCLTVIPISSTTGSIEVCPTIVTDFSLLTKKILVNGYSARSSRVKPLAHQGNFCSPVQKKFRLISPTFPLLATITFPNFCDHAAAKDLLQIMSTFSPVTPLAQN